MPASASRDEIPCNVTESCPKKVIHRNSRLPKYRAQCSLGDVLGVMRDRDFSTGFNVTLDFVAPRAGTVKSKSEHTKAARNLAVAKSRKASH